MSRGKWQRCPYTGRPLRILSRANEEALTWEGYFDRSNVPDCDLFDVRSIAAVCGFRDVAYFVGHVLPHQDCRIHIHRVPLLDAETGELIVEVVATHTTSAQVGGGWWHDMQRRRARERATTHSTRPRIDVSSGQAIRKLTLH